MITIHDYLFTDREGIVFPASAGVGPCPGQLIFSFLQPFLPGETLILVGVD